MFQCILCLKRFDDANSSIEHVFPDALGGLLTLRELCVPCNSHLGQTIDAPLVNHRYMQWSRRNLGLLTRAGRVPNPLDLGTVTSTGQGVRWEPDGRLYFQTMQIEHNGETVFMVDETDAHRLPSMIDKVRRRRGVDARGVVVRGNDAGSLSFELGFDDEGYRYGILKVAYELGCKLLGPTYVDDPTAARFRNILSCDAPSREILEASQIPGSIGGLYGPAMLPLPGFSDSWLAGVVFSSSGLVRAYVRMFNRFDGNFILSQNAAAYECTATGRGWLIDVAARTLRETDIEEMRKLALITPPPVAAVTAREPSA